MKSDHNFRLMSLLAGTILLASASGLAQTCITSDEMDAATRTAIQNAANRYFDMASRGDAASLKQNAIPEQQYATQKALVAQDEGVVKADQGQIAK